MVVISKQELKLINQDYRSRNNLPNANLYYRGVDSKKQLVFSVYREGKLFGNHTLVRRDMSVYDNNPILNIPSSISQRLLVNDKRYLVDWINRKTNLDMIEKDIERLVLRNNKVTIITNPNSNRFYNNFTINIG